MKLAFHAALAAVLIPLAAAGASLPQLDINALTPGQLAIEPSFEAASTYFRPPNTAKAPYRVEFRRAGTEEWREAFEPVSDEPKGVWKGSLFDLEEDAAFEVRVLAAGGEETIAPVAFRTWSSHPPIARVVDLSTLKVGPEGLVLSEQGTPEGWIKYTAPAGWRLERAYDANDPQTAAITFQGARYVILENVRIVGGRRHGVAVRECDSVRILNCELSGWGRVGVQQFPDTGKRGMYVDEKGEVINWDGAVVIDRSARTVVERCYIHDPRGRANSWTFSHPTGPSAIHVDSALGGIVLRWNDCIGSDEHRFNDVLEAIRNNDPKGGFFRDSDISGNFAAFGNDDGVELGGGGMNVRFYGNKVEGTVCAISTGPCFYGPQFAYGNLLANPGDESGLPLMFFKNSHGVPQGGKRHFIGNTLFGPAAVYGGYGKPAAGAERIGYMRNNVFVAGDARLPGQDSRRDDFDHDVFWLRNNERASSAYLEGLRSIGQEKHGVAVDPRLAAPAKGNFRLAADSRVRGRAAAVPNLSRGGDNPGAFPTDSVEVPYRPLSLTAAPAQLDFATPQTGASGQVTLRVPEGAAAVPFEIRKNDVFTWFDVAPASGTVRPGEQLTLTVTVNPAALHGRPRFRGAFLVRTPTGLSRPVTVYARGEFTEDLRPATAPNSLYLDAAGLVRGSGDVQRTDAPGVANGRYVALRQDGARLDASFTVTKRGSYLLLVRAAPAASRMRDCKFQVAVDGGKPFVASVEPGYHWAADDAGFRVVLLHGLGELAAGPHRLALTLESGELRLNELIITDNPGAFFPQEWQRTTPEAKPL